MHLMVRFIIFFYKTLESHFSCYFILLFFFPFSTFTFFTYSPQLRMLCFVFLVYSFSLVHGIFFILCSGSTTPSPSLLVSIFSMFCTFYSFLVSFSFSSQVFWTFYLFFLNESLISCPFATPPAIWEENLLFSLSFFENSYLLLIFSFHVSHTFLTGNFEISLRS